MALERVENGLWPFKRKLRFRFDELDLKKNKTFIIPTGFGLVFGTLLLVLMMFALGYANNLLYFFVFLLISMALSTMFITNQNTEKIAFVGLTPTTHFAGESSDIFITLKNTSTKPRYGVQLKLQNNVSSSLQFLPLEENTTAIQWQTNKRGQHKIPNIQIFCTYPFGILKSWKLAKSNELYWVYPQKKGSLEFPAQLMTQAKQNGAGIFKSLNEYQKGNSHKRIHWRASSKHQALLVKNFELEEEYSLPFTWSHTQHLQNTEDRLSQLCLWIDLAEKRGVSYSLSIGTFVTELSQGPTHYKRCMEALANYRELEHD